MSIAGKVHHRPPRADHPSSTSPPPAGCLRGGATDIKTHAWFSGVVWDDVFACRVSAPFVPRVRGAKDTSNFDSYPDSDEEGAKRLPPKDAALFSDFDSF